MTETTTDAQTPEILWQRAMDRVAENDRLRTEAHEAVERLAAWGETMGKSYRQDVTVIRRWMERCG